MKFLTTLLMLCILVSSSFAQEDTSTQKDSIQEKTQNQTIQVQKPKPSLEELYVDKNLTEQFQVLTEKSETYNEYKVIKKSSLNAFWRMVEDSVSNLKQSIAASTATIDTQNAEVQRLEGIVTKKDEELSTTDFAMTHITFLGIDFTKSTFIVLSVVVILALALLLAIGFFQYNHNKNISVQKTKELDELESEFETFKQSALDKQVKLNRELQTERNALEEMRSKSTISKRMHA